MAPLLIAGVAIVFVIGAIAFARVHAFFALVLAALLVAVLGVASGTIEAGYAAAVELAMTELGIIAGRIAFVIVAAAVIGVCLTESGAAPRIVEAMVRLFGEKRAAAALLASGFVLSIPVFFDTVFILLLPLAQALARRTGGRYVYYLLAICAGGVITHSSVPPTPGPLVLAEMLRIDLAVAILGGCAVGVPVAVFGLYVCRWLAQRTEVAVPALAPGEAGGAGVVPPPLGLALLPVLAPLVLIAVATLTTAVPEWFGPTGKQLLQFLGNKNIALLIALVIALWLVVRSGTRSWRDLSGLMAGALETASVIILITSAGGAFGAMIKRAGIEQTVTELTAGGGVDVILLAWILAVVVRIAQGSATVAMMTSGGIMMAVAGTAGDVHPLYVYLAIGYGSFCCSWMNDSGFWLVSRLGGLTERESLRTWTLMTTAISIAGLILTWVLARLLPLT